MYNKNNMVVGGGGEMQALHAQLLLLRLLKHCIFSYSLRVDQHKYIIVIFRYHNHFDKCIVKHASFVGNNLF